MVAAPPPYQVDKGPWVRPRELGLFQWIQSYEYSGNLMDQTLYGLSSKEPYEFEYLSRANLHKMNQHELNVVPGL